MMKHNGHLTKNPKAVTLKAVAEYVGLATGTVSLVLNHQPESIPQQTRDRVFAAARKLNYQPNPFARALRTRQVPGRSYLRAMTSLCWPSTPFGRLACACPAMSRWLAGMTSRVPRSSYSWSLEIWNDVWSSGLFSF